MDREFEEIVEIEELGSIETYDLEIDSEYHNFYANNICVSNSHAVSYSYVAMQTLFVKKYYPTEFYTALVNNAKNDEKWLSAAIMGAFSKGIKVIPPTRKSQWDWTMIDDNTISMGFSSIKGMGEVAYKELQEADIANIDKESFFTYQFSKFNKANFEACLHAGVFDDWSDSRDELMSLRKHKIRKNTMQMDLFGQNQFDIVQQSLLDNTKPTPENEKYEQFLKACTVDLNLFNNISKMKDDFLSKYNMQIQSVMEFENPNQYYYFVLVSSTKKVSKNGKNFWSLEIGDGGSTRRIIVWEDGYDKIKNILKKGSIYLTKFKDDDGWLKFQDGCKFKQVY
jgi:DNA polymerase III alpha subunit